MKDHVPQGSRRIALASLLVAWLAFNFPVFAGRVAFPVDIARAKPPNSLGRAVPKPANPLESDAFDLYYPWRTYLGDRLRDGDLPLWDPHRLAGTPFAANPQAAVWYPPNWLFAFLPFLTAYTLIAVASSLGALLLAYWFFRVLDLHRYAAAGGAIVFACCGFLVAWSMHPTFIASAMWLPLALGGIEAAVRGRPRRGIPLAGLGLALSVLGGQTQVTIYVWLAVGLWAAVAVPARALGDRRGRPRAAIRSLASGALILASAFGLGAALSSLQLLGTVELSSHIIRGAEPYDALVGSAFTRHQVATLFVPDRFGNPVDDNFVGNHNYTEAAAYVGVAALLLALLALWGRRDRITFSLGIIGVVGILAAFGTPFYRLLYAAVPGLSQTRAIGRSIFLLDAALAGLAAVGMDHLIRGRRLSKASVVASAALVLGGVALAAVLPRVGVSSAYLAPRLAVGVAAVVVAAALAMLLRLHRQPGRVEVLALPLVAILGVDLWLFGFGYHPFRRSADLRPPLAEIDYLHDASEPRPRIARRQGPVIPLNGALVYDLYDVHGNDTFILARTVDLLSLAQDQSSRARYQNRVFPFLPDALAAPVIDLMGVTRVVAPPNVPGASDALFSERFAVLDQPGAFPASFLTTCWELLPEDAVLDRVRSKDTDRLGSSAVVDDGPEARDVLGSSTTADCRSGGAVMVDRYEPERVELVAEVRERSVLVLTDAWYPGWEARVDGRATAVFPVDHALRGVVVGPGSHHIELAFRPPWLPMGIGLTGAAVLLAGGYGLGVDRRFRARRSR